MTSTDEWGSHSRRGSPTSSSQYQESPATAGDQTFAAITHILGLLTWIIGPLIVLIVSEDTFVRENAKNALNWQLLLTIYVLLSVVLLLVAVGFFFLAILPFINIIVCIIAAVKASDGEAWSYPATPSLL